MKKMRILQSCVVSVITFFLWMTAADEVKTRQISPDFTEVFQEDQPQPKTKHQPTDQGFPRSTTA